MAKIGMQHPVFAPIVSESGGTITYGAGVVIGRAVSGALNWTRSDDILHGDDAVAETDNRISGYTLDVGSTEMTEDVETVVLGTVKNASNEYEDTDAPGPYGGHGYIQVLKRRGILYYRALWYPKISFGVQSENDQTKGQNVTWGTPAIHGLGMPVYNDATGKAKFRKKKVFNNLPDAVAWLDALANISGNVQGLTLSSSAISIAVAGTSTLTPTSVPSGASASNVTWSSADTSIATVSDAGVVTGVAAGTTIVSAHYGAIVANCRVTVTAT